MATALNIKLSLGECGEYHVPGITVESAIKASEILQENHEIHHIFFNDRGFHNHIVHQILTLYALGASPETLQKQYNNNTAYQRPPVPINDAVIQDLEDPSKFSKYLGDETHYRDYLSFFKSLLDQHGYEKVLNDYLFKGDELAEDMLTRLANGAYHCLIHLGCGLEFKQPAIIAEALAMTAAHNDEMAKYMLGSEKAAGGVGKPTSKSLVAILKEIHADRTLSDTAQASDPEKSVAVIRRATDKLIDYASQWTVRPGELEEKFAESTNAVVYYNMCAQRPPKQVKLDFFLIHAITSSIYLSTFMKQSWISDYNKRRLLEWKTRLDLCYYVAQRSPKLDLDEILNYKPAQEAVSGNDYWDSIIHRAVNLNDDGHANKLIRCLAHAEKICKPYEHKPDFMVKGKMWPQLGYMAIDSLENTEPMWVRNTGFDEAWVNVGNRPVACL